MANTGLLLEVLITALVLMILVIMFSIHYFSLGILLKNEAESSRILRVLVLSDDVVSHLLSVERMGVYVNNLVDCSRLSSLCGELNGIYVSCGPYRCGEREGKIVVKRLAVYRDNVVEVEVGR